MKVLYVWVLMSLFTRTLGGCNDEATVTRLKRDDHEEADEDHHDEDEDHEDEESGDHHDHTSIIESLFKKYDASASPTHGTDRPTVIMVNVQVLSMDEISDSKMEYIIDTRMTFSWLDERLVSHDCKDEGIGCDDHFDMKMMSDKLWFPDLYILNSRTAKNHEQPLRNGMVYLRGSGNVMLSKRLTMTLRCPMDLTLYPMDTQSCPIIICPYSLTESELKLKWYHNGIGLLDDFQAGHSRFSLIPPVVTGQMKWKYDGPDVSGNFSCVNATFILARLNGYHMGYSYAVTSFIVVVSWISFWLPVTAVPARVTLGVTSLLTLLTTANYVRSALPPISYVTAVDVWVGLCTIFVFCSLLLFPVSHYLTSSNTTENPLTLQVQSKVRPGASRMCKTCGGFRVDHRFGRPSSEERGKQRFNLDGICRKVFPVMFIVFNIAYWSYYIPRSNQV